MFPAACCRHHQGMFIPARKVVAPSDHLGRSDHPVPTIQLLRNECATNISSETRQLFAARIEILRSGKNRNLAISQLCEKLKWRAVICLTRVKKPDTEIATTLVVIDTDSAKSACHSHTRFSPDRAGGKRFAYRRSAATENRIISRKGAKSQRSDQRKLIRLRNVNFFFRTWRLCAFAGGTS